MAHRSKYPFGTAREERRQQAMQRQREQQREMDELLARLRSGPRTLKETLLAKAERLPNAVNIAATLADEWDRMAGKAKDKERRKKERLYRKRTIRRWLKAKKRG